MSAVTGQARVWARDMAIVGGVTAFLAPLPAILLGATASFIGASAMTGCLTGGLLGAAMPGMLEWLRGRIPLAGLVALGPIPGAVWGGVVGAMGFAFSGVTVPLVLCVLSASLAGAIQFGLFWLPYTVQTVRGGPLWPVVLGACIATPVIGIVTIITIISVMSNVMVSLH